MQVCATEFQKIIGSKTNKTYITDFLFLICVQMIFQAKNHKASVA